MPEDEPQEFREITEADIRLADQMRQELYRALEEAEKRPPLPPGRVRPGRFSEPLGMMPDGTPQKPLTEEEKRHNEEVRERAREEARRARDDAGRRPDPGQSDGTGEAE